MRKPDQKPIIFALGPHTLDEHNIDTTIREGAMFELCNRIQPGIIQDVVIPYAMTDWGGAIIQIKKRNRVEEGWQRNFLAAALLDVAGHARSPSPAQRGRRPVRRWTTSCGV